MFLHISLVLELELEPALRFELGLISAWAF